MHNVPREWLPYKKTKIFNPKPNIHSIFIGEFAVGRNKNKSVGIYVRVSTDEQAKEGYSISAQKKN